MDTEKSTPVSERSAGQDLMGACDICSRGMKQGGLIFQMRDDEGQFQIMMICSKECSEKVCVEAYCFVCGNSATPEYELSVNYVEKATVIWTMCSFACRDRHLESIRPELDLRYICCHCGKEDDSMMRCSRCKKSYYCNLNCQRADWKVHRDYCSQLASTT